MALCWSRSYGWLALRNCCNLMQHPFEDAVMDRVKRVPIEKPAKSGRIENCRLPNHGAMAVWFNLELKPRTTRHFHLRHQI